MTEASTPEWKPICVASTATTEGNQASKADTPSLSNGTHGHDERDISHNYFKTVEWYG